MAGQGQQGLHEKGITQEGQDCMLYLVTGAGGGGSQVLSVAVPGVITCADAAAEVIAVRVACGMWQECGASACHELQRQCCATRLETGHLVGMSAAGRCAMAAHGSAFGQAISWRPQILAWSVLDVVQHCC